MSGARAGQAGDDDRRRQFDVVDLGMPVQQIGQQQTVLQQLHQLGVEVHDSRGAESRNLLQRSEIHAESVAVIIGTEVVEPGLRAGLGVQGVGIERALGRHRRHHVANRLDRRWETRLGEVVENDWRRW
ncbi:hypothetical protein M4D79_24115 [Mycolicibacterium novocastrense]|nr:hypothetical protein M4D79_24115 [Mycolicibacterium novocastrense]